MLKKRVRVKKLLKINHDRSIFNVTFFAQPVASCAPRTSRNGLAFIPLYLLHNFLTHYNQDVLL